MTELPRNRLGLISSTGAVRSSVDLNEPENVRLKWLYKPDDFVKMGGCPVEITAPWHTRLFRACRVANVVEHEPQGVESDFSVILTIRIITIASAAIHFTGVFRMNKIEILNDDFLEARAHLLEVAAFLDRLERATGSGDYRSQSFAACVAALSQTSGGKKTAKILEFLSDPTDEPVAAAPGKSASGAWPGFAQTSP